MDTARIIVPMAFDLVWENNRVVLGPGTRKACDKAISLARFLRNVRIFVSATKVGPKYGHAPLGKMMCEYLLAQDPRIRVDFHEAETFDTVGEILATALYTRQFMHEHGNPLTKVCFMAKRYHSLSVKQLAHEIFFWQNVNASHETIIHDLSWFVWYPWLQAAEIYERFFYHKRMKKLEALQAAVVDEDEDEEESEGSLFSMP